MWQERSKSLKLQVLDSRPLEIMRLQRGSFLGYMGREWGGRELNFNSFTPGEALDEPRQVISVGHLTASSSGNNQRTLTRSEGDTRRNSAVISPWGGDRER